ARKAASSTCRPACGPTISIACSWPTCSTAAWCCSSIWAGEQKVNSKAFLLLLLMIPSAVLADRIADIRNTKHNLSATGPGTLKADTETQVCVFCHTPHGATQGVTPLWNPQLSNQTYTTYTSPSLHAHLLAARRQGDPGLARPAGRKLEALPLVPRRHARHRQRQCPRRPDQPEHLALRDGPRRRDGTRRRHDDRLYAQPRHRPHQRPSDLAQFHQCARDARRRAASGRRDPEVAAGHGHGRGGARFGIPAAAAARAHRRGRHGA